MSKSDFAEEVPYTSSKEVRNFFSNVTVPIKKEHAGTSGSDYADNGYSDPVNGYKRYISNSDPENLVPFGKGTANGYYNPVTNNIVLRNTEEKDSIDSADVHETYHGLAAGRPYNFSINPLSWWNVLFRKFNPGISEKEDGKLKSAYGFEDSDLGSSYRFIPEHLKRNEEHSTNGQYQFKIYRNLSIVLGHPATYEEYKKYVSGMTDDQVRRFVDREAPNAYMQRMIERVAGPKKKHVLIGTGIPESFNMSSIDDIKKQSWYLENKDLLDQWLNEFGRDRFDGKSIWTVRPKDAFDRIYNSKKRMEELKRINPEAMRKAWLEVAKLRNKRNVKIAEEINRLVKSYLQKKDNA